MSESSETPKKHIRATNRGMAVGAALTFAAGVGLAHIDNPQTSAEATKSSTPIERRMSAKYQIGQLINPDNLRVYQFSLINTPKGTEPQALVTINGDIISIPLNDPHLSSFDRQKLTGFLRIEAGTYSFDGVTNPDYTKNIAKAFHLPHEIWNFYNNIPVPKGELPRSVFIETGEVLYRTEDGREFPVSFPLNSVQPPLSGGSTPPSA